MAVIFRTVTRSSLSLPFPNPRNEFKASSAMAINDEGRSKLMEFPFVSPPHRKLMVDLISTVEDRLYPQLLPCSLPPDVQYYESQSGSAKASLSIRSGVESSPIDFILGSWVHSKLPTGGELNITSFSAFLNSSTDAPNFLIELIQTSPTSLVLILDLPPRKDPVLYPEYLKTFYEDTSLDTRRQVIEKIPEVRPYFSPSLYIRCVVSPAAIMVHIETEYGGAARMEQIMQNYLDPVAKEMLLIWLDQCASVERVIGDDDRAYLTQRDGVIKKKTYEIDLGSSFPRLFGQEVAGRVLEAMRAVFSV